MIHNDHVILLILLAKFKHVTLLQGKSNVGDIVELAT